jgi:hypothetical protein
MPPIRRHSKDHTWTPFEVFLPLPLPISPNFINSNNAQMQTMLSLIVRGAHLEDYTTTNRSTTESSARQTTYENFCTALNDALHKGDYSQDIYRKDIIKQLDKMLIECKHVVGKGGLVERGKARHLTRALTYAWKRGSQMNFDGSIGEWQQWRRHAMENQSRRYRGLRSIEEEEDRQKGEREACKFVSYVLSRIVLWRRCSIQTLNTAYSRQ